MKIGLQTRLVAGIALVASLLVLSVGWYWSVRESRELSQALTQREQRLTRLMTKSFAAPIWNLDNTAINSLLDAVMADPEVQAIELRLTGLSTETFSRQRSSAATRPLRREFDIFYQLSTNVAPTPVAHATLVLTSEWVQAQVAQTRRFVVGLLAAVLAAIVAASYVLVNRLVKRPVSRLEALARRVAKGELGATTAVAHTDEIGALTQQFNQMSAQLLASSEGLRRSEARYRSLFENAAEGIFQIDARGHLLDLNRALAKMLGLSTAAQQVALGQRLTSLVQLDGPELKRIVRGLNRHRLLQQVPILLTLPNGQPLWVELSAQVMAATPSQGLRIEGMVSDISLRRLAEQELSHHRDHLEELVTERTQALSQAMQLAEAANQSKSRFLATMSHEFRTPLNAILGFSQILQMDASLSAPQRNKINLVRDSGEHLLGLITDVLDMASIEAGKLRLHPGALELRSLVELTCEATRLRAEQKQLSFSLTLEPALPYRVEVDGKRLRQVLLNLLANAVKFTDTGGLSLNVRLLGLEAASEPGQNPSARLQFEVSDSGIGIPALQLGRLFLPFEQVGDDSRCLGGTGLGLSISQQLVRSMGGDIRVRSEPGVGSSFTFELSLPALT
jgi:PAS domain S-box-containing protein